MPTGEVLNGLPLVLHLISQIVSHGNHTCGLLHEERLATNLRYPYRTAGRRRSTVIGGLSAGPPEQSDSKRLSPPVSGGPHVKRNSASPCRSLVSRLSTTQAR
ncbi:hypothetical protein MTO96_011558 [Rhipicephalus appendiculatus]